MKRCTCATRRGLVVFFIFAAVAVSSLHTSAVNSAEYVDLTTVTDKNYTSQDTVNADDSGPAGGHGPKCTRCTWLDEE